MRSSLQSDVGDIEAAEAAHLTAVGAAMRAFAATTSESSTSRDHLALHVGEQTELAVDSKSAVDDPNTKSAVGDSSVSIGSVYMSEDINPARPYVAVNEGHVFHATLEHLKIRDPTSEKSKNIS